MLNVQTLQNKAAAGFETMYVYIEESTDFDTITVNIQKMLHIAENEGKEYDVMDYCISFNGTYFEHGSTSNIVFSEEEEVIKFCTNYLWELREEEGDIISLSEARKEVVNNSNGSFKYS
tara:strand:- start:8 stop:364 length:357 start_codon:yes stop_codon:yes gene_type:complete